MDYWVIYEKDSFSSFHNYNSYMKFASYEDAESFLLRDKTIIKAEQKYADLFIADDIIFQSTTHNMSDTPDGEQIPVLYSIYHMICKNTSFSLFYDRLLLLFII